MWSSHLASTSTGILFTCQSVHVWAGGGAEVAHIESDISQPGSLFVASLRCECAPATIANGCHFLWCFFSFSPYFPVQSIHLSLKEKEIMMMITIISFFQSVCLIAQVCLSIFYLLYVVCAWHWPHIFAITRLTWACRLWLFLFKAIFNLFIYYCTAFLRSKTLPE